MAFRSATDRVMQPEKPILSAVRGHPEWSPQSWLSKTATQQPTYPDSAALDRALVELRELPPLVTSWEVLALKRKLAEAAEGRGFMLQGGDCAESFSDCTSGLITNRLKVLLQMSLVLVHGLKLPVVRVGRFAGQYAKPRSADTETKDGVTLPSYRGDIVNGSEFEASARAPDPKRLIQAHSHSAMTMNFVRSLIDGGFADLHHPEYWDLAWVEHSPLQSEYKKMTEAIGDSVRFMETLVGDQIGSYQRVDFYTSHEALLLHYEQSLQPSGAASVGLVQSIDTFPVDRHAHRRARWRARRILSRYPQSDRYQSQSRARRPRRY